MDTIFDNGARHLVVEEDDPALPATSRLIEQLDRYLASLYPAESNHLMSAESLRQPNVTVLTASLAAQVVGCVALVNHEGVYAEIKRVFVLPGFRRMRIGQRLLETLESRTRAASRARLETGVFQPEALALFRRAGYQQCGPFGNCPNDPLSVFMEKRLG